MNSSRINCAVRTIEALCHLAQGEKYTDFENAIIYRATTMLRDMWEVEVNSFRSKPSKQRQMQVFWTVVGSHLSSAIVYSFKAVYDETVNYTNNDFNVVLKIQPAKAAKMYTINLIMFLPSIPTKS
jgi:hypothetical protein